MFSRANRPRTPAHGRNAERSWRSGAVSNQFALTRSVIAIVGVLLVTTIACRNSTTPVAPTSSQAGAKSADNLATPAKPPTHFAFHEAATESGIVWQYHNGSEADHGAILESLGGGVGVLDYDGDGWLDVCFPGGGKLEKDLSQIPLNTGLFRGGPQRHFVDVSHASGIESAEHYTHGVVSADYDNDGFADLLITGYGGLRLWHNQGDGTFIAQEASAGLDDQLWSSSAAWGDFNGDGNADLYVAHYVTWSPKNHPFCPAPSNPELREICSPRQFDGVPDVIYLSQGDGTFSNQSAAARLKPEGKGLGVVAGDIDLDGDLDIYVGNDTTENFLYLNDGQAHFDEMGLIAGVATDDRGVPDGSMGVDMTDYNRDGRPDLWVANFEREAFALYRNEGGGQFLHVSQATGITALGGLFVGFGTAFGDLDRDGDEDVAVANGHVIKYPRTAPRRQQPLLMENLNGSRFQRVLPAGSKYFATEWESRGLALGDIDNDGDLDITIAHVNEPSMLLWNETKPAGDWVGIRLVGRKSNRSAVGAHLILTTTAGKQLRLVKGGGSYLSQSDYRVLWGVPAGAQVESLTIAWPAGEKQTITPQVNQWQTVLEPLAN